MSHMDESSALFPAPEFADADEDGFAADDEGQGDSSDEAFEREFATESELHVIMPPRGIAAADADVAGADDDSSPRLTPLRGLFRAGSSPVSGATGADESDADAEDTTHEMQPLTAEDDLPSLPPSPPRASAGTDAGPSDGKTASPDARTECETLKGQNQALTQQLRDMRMIVGAHRANLDSKEKKLASLQHSVDDLQSSLWAAVTGAQPRQSMMAARAMSVQMHSGPHVGAVASSGTRAVATGTGTVGANTNANGRRARAHTEPAVQAVSRRPQANVRASLAAPPAVSQARAQDSKPKRLSFSAFFGRGSSGNGLGTREKDGLLGVGEGKEAEGNNDDVSDRRMRAQSEITHKELTAGAKEDKRVRAKSYAPEVDNRANSGGSFNSYPALQRRVAQLESKLLTFRSLQQAHKRLEEQFVGMKLDYARKCSEYEVLEMSLSLNANEQQSVVGDLNNALIDKVKLRNQIDQLQGRLDKVTKEYEFLQQHHKILQKHIGDKSRAASVASTISNGSGWRLSLAQRFSSFVAPPAIAANKYEQAHEQEAGRTDVDPSAPNAARKHSSKARRKDSKVKHKQHKHGHHGHHHHHKSKRKHAKAKRSVSVSDASAGGDMRVLAPQPLYLAAKSPVVPPEKDVGLEVLTEGVDGHAPTDEFGFVHKGATPQFRGWFGANGGKAAPAGAGERQEPVSASKERLLSSDSQQAPDLVAL